jgi:hypothetical protein
VDVIPPSLKGLISRNLIFLEIKHIFLEIYDSSMQGFEMSPH